MSDQMKVDIEHIALCANKSCNCLSVGPGNLISFGCSNSVILYQQLSWCKKQQVMLYNHHKGRVLCTKWLKSINNEIVSNLNYLLSGSTDKTVGIWRYESSSEKEGDTSLQLQFLFALQGHKDSITSIDGLFTEDSNMFLIVSASADSSVRVWAGKDLNSVECIQVFDLKNAFVLDVALHFLPSTNIPILACAADDFKVKLFVFNNASEKHQFEKVLDLKGHEDWVRSVDFINFDDSTLYLVSASQDSFIRIWKLVPGNDTASDELKLKKQNFTVSVQNTTQCFNAAIDAVLSGHENWVYSVQWRKQANGDIVLLSASIDKTIVIWTYEKEDELWNDSIRMGELGGNTLGFYGALFSSDGEHIIANSYSGALHGWDKAKNGKWKAAVTIGGHVSPVSDIAWEPKNGRYLISVGDDQTARLFAKWKETNTWHEIARPQIHGYDMHCLALINSTKYVSGADEKVLRVFDASKNFVDNFENLTDHIVSRAMDEIAEGATVPALGLSNKAVMMKQDPVITDRREQYIENLFSPVKLTQPPPESYLLQNTLWPESRKVYGHVYELFCVCCNHAGTMVASAAKSSQPKHSGVMVWDVSKWEEACVLYGHTLTVTQLEFSPNDKFLLSVSRDRTWILHEVTNPKDFKFEKVGQSEKKTGHSRIIWSCSWSHDSIYFATASRDKKVAVWASPADKELSVKRVGLLDCKEPVTAVAFSKSLISPSVYQFAVGLESGIIKIFKLTSDLTFVELMKFNNHFSHCSSVKRLQWRPCETDQETSADKLQWLASCGTDHQVKLFKITSLL